MVGVNGLSIGINGLSVDVDEMIVPIVVFLLAQTTTQTKCMTLISTNDHSDKVYDIN